MTSEEEMVLKEYLSHYGEIEDDEDFEAWYMQRYENAESEAHYKEHAAPGPSVEAPVQGRIPGKRSIPVMSNPFSRDIQYY